MVNKVIITHHTNYTYSKIVMLSPHVLRLKPLTCHYVEMVKYELTVKPMQHQIYWFRDVFDNDVARIDFNDKTNHFNIVTSSEILINDLNPFNFILDYNTNEFPFVYNQNDLLSLQPYLLKYQSSDTFINWIMSITSNQITTIDFLVKLNRYIHQEIEYKSRETHGVQSCEETLKLRSGSCRDLSFLLIQTLREFNIAARFVSGYHIDLSHTDSYGYKINLHAWVEAYLPGAGWVGLDPAIGLFANHEYIALCHAPDYESISPLSGRLEPCEVSAHFDIEVSVLERDKSESADINQSTTVSDCGDFIDKRMMQQGLHLTMGSEPTFTSTASYNKPEWDTTALGNEKYEIAEQLYHRLKNEIKMNALPFHSIGKSYSGEILPRWSFCCYWVKGDVPIWRNLKLLSAVTEEIKHISLADAELFMHALAEKLKINKKNIHLLYADSANALCQKFQEGKINRDEFIYQINQAQSTLTGFSLPIKMNNNLHHWEGTEWNKSHIIILNDIDLPILLRLPHDNHHQLHENTLCVTVLDNQVNVSIPKIFNSKLFLAMIGLIEDVAQELNISVSLGGYEPPLDGGLQYFKISPDPGVIEINMPVSHHWNDVVHYYSILYDNIESLGLSANKFLRNGRPMGSGGGHHITIGGVSPDVSPVLNNPGLFRSIVTYWQHHPALSYLFSGLFIGETSQAPRLDESRIDNLKELEIEFYKLSALDGAEYSTSLHSLQYYFTDLCGNPHRSELCIDKLFIKPDQTVLQGLLEFRAFETPPHLSMCLLQFLLLRALISYLWDHPYHKPFKQWGNQLHDRFMLPYFIWNDFCSIVTSLNESGYLLDANWYASFYDYRFPLIGETTFSNMSIELRYALEPWNVISTELLSQFSSRTVDSSLERIQIKVTGFVPGRHIVTCNGLALPMYATTIQGEYVAGLRFKANDVPITLHQTIKVHDKIEIDIVDRLSNQSIGGCTYKTLSQQKLAAPICDEYDAFQCRNKRFSTNKIKSNVDYIVPDMLDNQVTFDLCAHDFNCVVTD